MGQWRRQAIRIPQGRSFRDEMTAYLGASILLEPRYWYALLFDFSRELLLLAQDLRQLARELASLEFQMRQKSQLYRCWTLGRGFFAVLPWVSHLILRNEVRSPVPLLPGHRFSSNALATATTQSGRLVLHLGFGEHLLVANRCRG